jgi:glycosyltransferase involved in cell wall biosynthesis/GT2 family glycosyltransferase
MGKLMLEEMVRQGIEVDLYLPLVGAEPPSIAMSPRLRIIEQRSRWRWRRWYSRTKARALFSSLLARTVTNIALSVRLLIEHRRKPYDAVYQLSTTELFVLGRVGRLAPPIIVHPCTHAAGELRWHRAEQSYALQAEGRTVHMAVRALLKLRGRLQPGELERADHVLGLSERFNELLRQDYRIPRRKLSVVRTPVDLNRFVPDGPEPRSLPRTLLFISRISTRKGVEEIIQLSHRLTDLAGSVRLLVIGGPTQWSDYRAHLARLNPDVAEYVGGVPSEELPALLRSATMLLVPSRYEPGSITTAEALGCGLPVVLSDEVGAGEVVEGPHVRFHRAGDVDGVEEAVRSLLEAIEQDEQELRAAARANAEQQFAPAPIVDQLIGAISSLVPGAGQTGNRPVRRAVHAGPAAVTVCICTRGRPDDLANALASIADSTHPVAQVVVSDDLHDPGTEQVCRQATVPVDYVLGPRRGLGANRNRALVVTTGDIVLFVDDDCLLRADFVATALERMRGAEARHGPGRVIVSGRVLERGRLIVPHDQTFLGFQSKPYVSDEGLRSIVMAATIFPSSVFTDLAFDPRIVYGYDEVDLASRAAAAGYVIVDCPEAINDHVPSDSGRDRNLSYSEASRLHVTLRRYALTEQAPLRATAFVIAAPLHHLAANVKRSGVGGLSITARTLGLAAAMTWRSR